ncbi:MAG: lytic murein transglycosylase B [Gammaproteobacteria bacterium]|nr:lytic murein transglycosylase B [Gammaproteobacteria bacterium]NNC96896.1 lytic murein transglycosylase B [Gammaproteobacteria bacterium]NNM13311.1 lytic murein transglycosylase B [Gammaproteobacteria bacterium]
MTARMLTLLFFTFCITACTSIDESQSLVAESNAQAPASQNAKQVEQNSESVWPAESETELAAHASVESIDLDRPLVKAFVEKMIREHEFTADEIQSVLAQGKNQTWILELIARPAEKSKEWYEYRNIFLNQKRIDNGKKFMQAHQATLAAAEKKFGVAPEIITAIIGVETQYGANYGKTKVLDALVTLGFNYPPRRKLFINQLEELFLLSREQGFDPTTLIGSYAGAMGNGQFIPSSYRDFAVDGDGDNIVDLWQSWPDTIFSVANYFNVHKWKDGEDVLALAQTRPGCEKKFPESKVSLKNHTVGSLRNGKCGYEFNTTLADDAPAMFLTMQQKNSTDIVIGFNNFYSITRYNRSPKYARAVFELSQEFLQTPEQSVAQ